MAIASAFRSTTSKASFFGSRGDSAVEGTTLATVFLVNLRRSRTSLEAAYKYLILSSVGIALAFIGTALVYYAGAANAGEIAVNWSTLRGAAASLNRHVIRVAFVFMRRLLHAAPWTGALFIAGTLAFWLAAVCALR